MISPGLTDHFGRSFEYLRLSLDDACNFRCSYCLPKGYHKTDQEEPLSLAEIRRLVSAFAEMGFWKVRLVGGEPTLRHDFPDIAAAIAQTPGVRRLALSTNGHRLHELAPKFRDMGIASVNVSVDSLDPARFARLTGRDQLPQIMDGIRRCVSLGFRTKLNAVLMRDLSETEIGDFLALTRTEPLAVRFIELMPASGNMDFFEAQHVSAQALLARLGAEGWRQEPRRPGDGPARRFSKEGHAGAVGVIAPYEKDFCSNCNRLRVTSRGGLRLCLFSESDLSLRRHLQGDDRKEALKAAVREALGLKEVSHFLPEGRFGDVRNFAMMGG